MTGVKSWRKVFSMQGAFVVKIHSSAVILRQALFLYPRSKEAKVLKNQVNGKGIKSEVDMLTTLKYNRVLANLYSDKILKAFL